MQTQNLSPATILCIGILFFTINSRLSAQFEWGFKAGISSYDLGQKNIQQWTSEQGFTKQFTEADYGHHFGLYARGRIGFIYVEPAVLFQSGSFSYTFEEYSESGVFTTIRKERYNHVSMPFMIGFKAGFFRLQGGPVGHVLINRTSDLFDPDTYTQYQDNFAFSLQAGAGVDIWKFRFDVNYEANVDALGTAIQIGKKSFMINQTPPRLVFTLGFKF